MYAWEKWDRGGSVGLVRLVRNLETFAGSFDRQIGEFVWTSWGGEGRDRERRERGSFKEGRVKKERGREDKDV